jgi:hypothetical protein
MDVPIPCPCPPKADGALRHPDGDTVTLRDRLDFKAGQTIEWAVTFARDEGAEAPEILATMTEWYALLGVSAWTLTDDHGKPLPVTRAAIRGTLLESPAAAIVADAADDLYMAAVLLPLVAAASKSSPPTPTEPLTSAPPASRAKRPKPSKPSLTTSTPTAVIARTTDSRAGASSTSPS